MGIKKNNFALGEQLSGIEKLRIQRGTGYEQNKKNIGKYINQVKKNRESE